MKTIAILQARMNSSRLPGKMLLPLLGKPLVQHVIERTRRATKLDFVVLAYPLLDHPSFLPVLHSFTSTPGVPLGSYAFQGDENDLVERYLGAARAYEADMIVRIPCDNPCVDPAYIDAAIGEYMSRPYNFYSNTLDAVWIQKKHERLPYAVDGVGCEVISLSTLKWLDEITRGHPDWREHPHKYWEDFVENCDELNREFSIDTPTSSSAVEYRLDVNTQADYEFIHGIYDHFQRNDFTAADVVTYLDSKNISV